jgi:hypothetical protein
MNIREATKSYEAWMRRCTPIISADLAEKHKKMRKDVYYFLRGTFYSWIQMWPEVCPELSRAPRVLASGDMHVGSFGTWRDSEGRMCWGVDDFDEAYPLAYTNDLVRIAASMKLVIDQEHLTIKFKVGCDALLEGYRECLRKRGHPLVLAEQEKNMEQFGIAAIDPPSDFWEELNHLPAANNLPAEAEKILKTSMPAKLKCKMVRRKAGMGSLGQQRFVAIAEWEGGCIAREAKAMVASACVWLQGQPGQGQSHYKQIIERAVRSPDPFQKIKGMWLLRRLSPDSNPIEISELPKERDEEILMRAMGREAANIHLGSERAIRTVLKDLGLRKPNWLRDGAKEMAKAVEKQWKKYQKG